MAGGPDFGGLHGVDLVLGEVITESKRIPGLLIGNNLGYPVPTACLIMTGQILANRRALLVASDASGCRHVACLAGEGARSAVDIVGVAAGIVGSMKGDFEGATFGLELRWEAREVIDHPLAESASLPLGKRALDDPVGRWGIEKLGLFRQGAIQIAARTSGRRNLRAVVVRQITDRWVADVVAGAAKFPLTKKN